MGVTSTFYIAQTGLQMAQSALEVVSHNVANVNTPGYSRQRINLEAQSPIMSRIGALGTGVDAQNITRMYDRFITATLVEKNSELSKFEAQKISIDSLEAIFNESAGNGINQELSAFWSSWQEVANNPEGNPQRVDLVEKATTLANHIVKSRADMDELKKDINRRIDEALVQANGLIREIAEINDKIVSQEAGQLNQANDLRDQRDQHILELAAFMDIDYFEDPADGTVSVITPKGTPLVMGTGYWSLDSITDDFGDTRVLWKQGKNGSVDITENISTGKIGGWIELRDEVMYNFYQEFEAFTEGLIFEVNRMHAQGAGLTKFTDITSANDISDFASIRTDFPGTDNDLKFVALSKNSATDNIGIRFQKAAATGTRLTVDTVVDPATGAYSITVTLPVNASGNPTVTAQEVAEAINSDQTENLPYPAPFPPAGPPYRAGDLITVEFPNGERGRGLITADWLNPDDPLGSNYFRLNHDLENTLAFGREITYGYEQARFETNLAGQDNDLLFKAIAKGAPGEDISIAYVDPGAANQPFSIAVTGSSIQINLATDATGQITTTAENIFEAIQSSAAASSLVTVERSENQSGAGRVTAMSPQYLDRSGSFDLFTYNPDGQAAMTRIFVNPDDTREDILKQIGATFSSGVEGISAEIAENSGEHYLRLKADDGWEFGFANDNSNALAALGLNTFWEGASNTTIKVNDVIKSDISKITTGRIDSDGLIPSGDNSNALEVADLKDKKFYFQGRRSTISEAYNTLYSDIGATNHTITRSNDFNQSLVDQMNQQRDMVSAVNLDEEMADLMKYQYMYQASAKLISATDELLQTLLAVK